MKISKKQIILAVVILIAISAGIYFFNSKKAVVPQNTATVKRGDIIQEVSVTGRVKAASTVDLGFEKGGKIQNVYVKVGDHIKQGDLLSVISSTVSLASLQEAQARLAELKRGSRPEEIAVKEAELAKYIQDLNNGYNGVFDINDDGFNKTDDAIHSKIAGTFSGFKTSSYKTTFSVCDTQLAVNTEWLRYTEEIDLDLWRSERNLYSVIPTQSDLDDVLSKTSQHLEKARAFLESLSRALTLDCVVANTTLDTYRTNINIARTNISATIANVNTKKQAIASLSLAVAKVRNELSLLKAGTAKEVIDAQEARVLSAQGELSKLYIYAPINGTLTKVDAISGELANASIPLLSIISDSSFEIDANVPEADIAKIKQGDIARITLDAYGSDVIFSGRVTTINPAETIIDNVPTYKVTLHFSKDDSRIKSGMTANIDIRTASRTNVLSIPARSTITKDDKKFVNVLNADKTTNETMITTGLRGTDGSIEVLSGVIEGNTIMITPKN